MAKESKPAKTLGRKKAKAEPEPKAAREAKAEPKVESKAAEARAPKPKEKAARGELLGAVEQALLEQLAQRMQLLPREILARALHSYAAAVAPGMKLPAVNDQAGNKKGRPELRLFVSVDGKPEVEVDQGEFVIGSGEGCDLRLDLPLISPRHARLLWREGRHLFEDLRSAKGSYLHGQPLDVRFLEDGDEIDLGGFLPLRFRLAAAGV